MTACCFYFLFPQKKKEATSFFRCYLPVFLASLSPVIFFFSSRRRGEAVMAAAAVNCHVIELGPTPEVEEEEGHSYITQEEMRPRDGRLEPTHSPATKAIYTRTPKASSLCLHCFVMLLYSDLSRFFSQNASTSVSSSRISSTGRSSQPSLCQSPSRGRLNLSNRATLALSARCSARNWRWKHPSCCSVSDRGDLQLESHLSLARST